MINTILPPIPEMLQAFHSNKKIPNQNNGVKFHIILNNMERLAAIEGTGKQIKI